MGAQRIVVCGNDQQYALIEAALTPADRERLARSPAYAKFLEHGFAVCAVICGVLDTSDLARHLGALRRCGVPWPAIQLLRPGDTRRGVQAPWSAGALHPNECGVRLASMLRRSVLDWTLAAAADIATTRLGAEDVLAKLLRAVLLAEPPIKSVPQLMSVTGLGHTALYHAWDAGMQPLCGLTLGEVLDWVVVLRALGLKTPGCGWRVVAARVGCDRKTLRAISQRTYNCAFDEVNKRWGVRAVVEFVDRVLVKGGLPVAFGANVLCGG